MGVYIYQSGTEKELKNAYIGGTPIKRIFIGANLVRGPALNFATQGPCQDGFHVPLNTEWQAIYNAGATIGAWASNNGNGFKTYLKLPFGGRRNTNSGTEYGGSYGYYRSSTGSSNGRDANDCYFFSSNIYPQLATLRCYGYLIRPFKNIVSEPNSSWITLYDGSGTAAGAGVFRNSSLGLISISSDGTNWITISDKNLGATNVYNDNDTLSEANCGKFYQRGNNYGFPYTGSVSTSSSQVNAQNYGPGNYYSSSTWRALSYWDSSKNNNLRGGVDGNVPV